jgi:hypothetical protein
MLRIYRITWVHNFLSLLRENPHMLLCPYIQLLNFKSETSNNLVVKMYAGKGNLLC